MRENRNYQIASKLREMAEVLEHQDANEFRITAYQRASDTIGAYPIDIGLVLEREGIEGLIGIPTIGRGIAAAIQEIITTGRWAQLERLRGTLEPDQLFQIVPGIGPALAHRIHDELDIDTLEALEIAAFDGRLKKVPGISERRLAAITPALAMMLGRRRQRFEEPSRVIPIALLLELDETYRHRAEARNLPLIAPKRFNPEGKSWLPIMHTTREEWHFTVMFSNTALAHKLERNFDWVVIYYYEHDHREGQYTVVTETRGDLIGRRVVRGREEECRNVSASNEQLTDANIIQ
jgi:putative hydrolase